MMGIDYRAAERFPFLHKGCKVLLKREGRNWQSATVHSIQTDRIGMCLNTEGSRWALDWYLETEDQVRLEDGETITNLIRYFLFGSTDKSLEQELIKAVKGAIDVFDKSNSVSAPSTPSREVPVKVHEHSGRKVEERIFSGNPNISLNFLRD